jgi:hypothetical protein
VGFFQAMTLIYALKAEVLRRCPSLMPDGSLSIKIHQLYARRYQHLTGLTGLYRSQ